MPEVTASKWQNQTSRVCLQTPPNHYVESRHTEKEKMKTNKQNNKKSKKIQERKGVQILHKKFGTLTVFSELVGSNWILLGVISEETSGSSKSSAII